MLLLAPRSRRRLVRGLTAIVLLLCARSLAGAAAPAPGTAAPSFSLKSLDGKDYSLASLRGDLVVLHFWATWCPACRREMPLLEEFSRARRGKVLVLGINLAEKATDVAAYARSSQLSFPILIDPRGNVAAAYGVLGLPVTVVVDREGRIAETVAMGSLTREGLDALVERHWAPRPER